MRKTKALIYLWLKKASILDISLIMTLVLLFVYTEDVFNVRLIIKITAVFGIIFYKFIGRNPYYWLFITLVLAYGHGYLWFIIDNHKYLINYWCLAISLSLFTNNPEESLKTNGRLLIGLCFLFATFWKAVTPEFTSGSFFEFLLLGGDSRFNDFSLRLNALPENFIRYNEYLIRYGKGHPEVDIVLLESSLKVKAISLILTYWTLFIEGAVALLFLWPNETKTRYARDFFLIVFIVTTYPVASVIGFAWLLTAMGTAQIRSRSIMMKLTYLLLFIFLAQFSGRLLIYLRRAIFYLTIH